MTKARLAAIRRTARERLVRMWDNLVSEMSRAEQQVRFVPEKGIEVFEDGPTTGTLLTFMIKPVAFELPVQRVRQVVGSAQEAKAPASIFVVLEGLVVIDAEPDDGFDANQMLLRGFGTRVGYFAEREGKLDHLLGWHIDEAPASDMSHPAYHLQLKNYALAYTTQLERLVVSTTPGNNAMSSINGRIRTPVPAHDPLSYLLQLFADHLMEREQPSADVKACFTSMLALHRGIRCDGGETRQRIMENKCVRGGIWYRP